jgi:cell division protein FtsX
LLALKEKKKVKLLQKNFDKSIKGQKNSLKSSYFFIIKHSKKSKTFKKRLRSLRQDKYAKKKKEN